ncbi:MAG: AAA family ATPase [Verrucomicrobia bacterium]|nr:AAA family ATPase [Verrucomicrobiota bacterium]
MKIETLHLKKFCAFKEAEFSFSTGINVFIGANGTGKSHLLKVLYASLKANERSSPESLSKLTGLETLLPQKLIGVFKPDQDGLGRLVFRGVGRSSAEVKLHTDQGNLSFQLTTPGNFKLVRNTLEKTPGAIFIPSRESLALYEGLIAAYDKRELSLDETFRDLCVALSSSALRGPRSAEIAALAGPFEKEILQGTVRLEGGKFYVYNDDGLIEAHLLSEGQRKIASLVRLMVNGSLTSNDLLFWDEPEANLNPRLVTKVAEALRALAAAGVQVFIATHDYLLTQELSLAAEYPDQQEERLRCPINFFALSRTETEGVTVQSGGTVAALQDNPILEEFAAHYDREQALLNREQSTTAG